MLKRTFDILLSLIGIILVIPVFPFIALLIKLDSKGPVFYRVDRIGKDMKAFKMLKFRTMLDAAINVGESLSPQYDPRVTPFGRLLRRTKMNEIPQLLNILKGDMAFVGPRPESTDLAELYPENAKKIFSVTPGLVGPNQILGRNEEEMYPPGVDVKKYYIEQILPNKAKVDLAYISAPDLFKDLKYILWGVKETLTGALNKSHIKDNRSQVYLLVADAILSIMSMVFVYALSLRYASISWGLPETILFLTVFLAVRLCCFVFVGLYSTLIRYISYHDIYCVFKGVTIGSLSLILFSFLVDFNGFIKLFAFVDWICLLILLSTLRFGLRLFWEKRYQKEVTKIHRVLIFGAGRRGYEAYRSLTIDKASPFEVIGFIDDAPEKYGKRMNGAKVLGNRYHIKTLAQLYKINEIIIAIQNLDPNEMNRIMDLLNGAGISYRLFSAQVYDNGDRGFHDIRNVDLLDIMPVEQINMDYSAIKKILAGKTVLINGAGGEMGLELCNLILRVGCKRLIVLERYEAYLIELLSKLYNHFPQDRIVPLLIGQDEAEVIEEIFKKEKPAAVIQASMKKYQSFLCIDNEQIMRDNYLRTFNLAKQCITCGSEFFVAISSLAAATNGNAIAESLRNTELFLQEFFRGSNCRLVIPRICDVIENRGGTVSVLENQIKNHEAITLSSTDGGVYLISKHSAAEFVLQTMVETIKKVQEEGIFVCNSGPPISLSEVASRIANLYGLKIGQDLLVKYIDSSPPNTDKPRVIEQSAPTSHPHIRFIKETGTFSNHESRESLLKFLASNNLT